MEKTKFANKTTKINKRILRHWDTKTWVKFWRFFVLERSKFHGITLSLTWFDISLALIVHLVRDHMLLSRFHPERMYIVVVLVLIMFILLETIQCFCIEHWINVCLLGFFLHLPLLQDGFFSFPFFPFFVVGNISVRFEEFLFVLCSLLQNNW